MNLTDWVVGNLKPYKSALNSPTSIGSFLPTIYGCVLPTLTIDWRYPVQPQKAFNV